MKFWDQHPSWEEAAAAWEKGAVEAAQKKPLRTLKVLPQMPGITEETAKNLKWKKFKYMVTHDKGGTVRRHFLKHPLRYGIRYLRSVFKSKSYTREKIFSIMASPPLKNLNKRRQRKIV